MKTCLCTWVCKGKVAYEAQIPTDQVQKSEYLHYPAWLDSKLLLPQANEVKEGLFPLLKIIQKTGHSKSS